MSEIGWSMRLSNASSPKKDVKEIHIEDDDSSYREEALNMTDEVTYGEDTNDDGLDGIGHH